VWAQPGHRLWRSATGSLACAIAALAGGCGDGPRAVDPAGVPESVDVDPLRGEALSGTPCKFARQLDHGSPGSGLIRVWLDCPRADDATLAGFVQVASVLTGDEPAEDSIRCQRDPRLPQLRTCRLRHGTITVDARATCGPDRCNPEEEARELMARVVERLATLAEQPCRLCPQFLSPHRVAELTSMFSGRGPRQLGTIEVKVASRIRYVALNGGIRVTSGRPPRVLIDDKQHQGEADIARGTYRNVKVIAAGDWNFLIEPR
jgi:hypothetical protein